MLQPIYWILAISVMLLLLVSVILGLVDRVRTTKEVKEINKKQLEWLDKMIKDIESEEK